MATIDNLSINISLAKDPVIRNINSIIKSLDSLDNKFSAVSSLNGFREGLNSLTDTFITLSRAMSGLDIKNLQSMNSSLGALARNVSALNGVGQSLSAIGKATAVSNKSKDELQEKISQLQLLKENALEAKAALQSIRIGRTSGDTAETSDDFRRLNGFGRNIGREKNNYGINPEAYDIYKNIIGSDLSDNATTAFAEYTGAIQTFDEEIKRITADIAKMKEELKTAPETITQAKAAMDENAYASFGGSLPWDDDFEVVKTKAEEVKAVGNPFENIAIGLQSLESISIPAGQFAGVTEIASAVSKMGKVDMSQLSTNLPLLANSLTSFSNLPETNTEPIYNLAASISKLGGKKIVDAASALPIITDSLSRFSTIQLPNTENLINLANALKKFGSAGAEKAVAALPKLTEQFRNLLVVLSEAPAVSDNVVRLAEAMASFSSRSQGVASAAKGFNLFGTHAKRAGISVKSLAARLGWLYANFFLVIRAARLAGKAIEYSSQMTEAMNVVDVAFGKMSNKMTEFMETSIEQFGLGKLAAAQYASRFQAMGKTLGITADEVVKANDFIAKKTSGNALAYKDLGDSVADMSINLTKLTADMASLYNQDYEDVAKDMQAVYTGMTRPLRKYGLDLTAATLKEWALANGLQADIDKMTQAEKTLLRYQYVMSNASIAMGDFQKTADTWANAMRTCKQLLQEFGRILGEGFINAFKPALLAFRNFMYTMLDLTQKGLNAVGKLLGWEKIDFGGAALAEDMEDFADATDDAADAAKKLKGQLRGIDELNNLTTTDKGSGGGASGSSIGYNGADLWEQIKETKEKYISDVDSWKELGERIADKIYEGLVNIDWDSRTEGARNFGTNLASFLNGLIKPETFKEVGKTLAKTIMLGVNFADAFADEFEFDELGVSIGEGINGFFENFDGAKTANTITKIAHGLETALKNAVKTIKWGEVFKDLFEFFSHLVIDNMDLVVKYLLISNAVGFVANFTTTLLTEIGRQLAAKIAAKAGIELTGMTITTIGSSFGVNLAQGVAANIAKQTGAKITSELATQGVTAEIGEVSVGVGAGTKVLGASTVGGYIAAAIVAAVVGYFTGNWIQKELSEKYGLDAWLFDEHGGLSGNAPNPYGNILNNKNKKTLTAEEQAELARKALQDKTKDFDLSNSDLDRGIKTYRTFTNTVRSTTQQIYDTKAAAAYEKLNKATKQSASNASTVGTAFREMGRDVSSSSSSFESLEKSSNSSFRGISSSGTKATNDVNKGLTSVKNTAGNAFAYNVWSSYGENIKNSLGSSIDDVKARWEALQKSMSTQVAISGGSSGGSTVSYVTTTTSTPKTVTNYDAPGIKTNPTWHNLPTKPSGMPTSAWESYLENWKKQNPGNYYAGGGFPTLGELFWAGESGAELVGSVNGKTAVASNAEITGIRDAIVQTSSEEITYLRQQNQLLQGILDKEFGISSDALFRSVRNSANNFTTRTGRPAF